jgi:hypothetical protein
MLNAWDSLDNLDNVFMRSVSASVLPTVSSPRVAARS